MWCYGGSIYSNPTRFCNQGTITHIKLQQDSVIRLNRFHQATKTDSGYANFQQLTLLLFTNNSVSVRWKVYDEGHCKLKDSTRCPSMCRKRHIIIFTTVWFIPCIMHRADASHLLLFPSCRNNTVNTFRASWMTKWWKIGVFSINCRGNWDFDEDA